ncbi:MAG: hypothetical protein IJ766_03430 [Clostridia bacterium]|nr:hypothetical protein [Clostridia bacterium]
MHKGIKKLLALLFVAVILVVQVWPSPFIVNAATFDEINDSNVFLKQKTSYTCTLASAAMMMRRYALLRGDSDWASITESSIYSKAWDPGSGLFFSFSYATSGGNISVNHSTLPGGSANRQVLINLLKEHPEGVEIHNTSEPHAVLLTDYTDGIFYCADPNGGSGTGRIPLTSAYAVRVENVSAYWYITSSKVTFEQHDHDFKFQYYQEKHPHYAYYQCQCGESYNDTSVTIKDPTCEICNPDEPYMITNLVCPSGTISFNEDFEIQGTILSTHKIRWVKASILNSDRETLQTNAGKWPQAKKYDLSNLNDQLDFSILPSGNYYFMIQAGAADIDDMEIIWRPFTVPALFSVSDYIAPDNYIVSGEGFALSGHMTCLYKITWVNATIIDLSDNSTVYKTPSKTPQSLEFDISELNDLLDFSILQPGNYKLVLKAGTYKRGDMPNIYSEFTVLSPAVSSTAPAPSPTSDPLTTSFVTQESSTIPPVPVLPTTLPATVATTAPVPATAAQTTSIPMTVPQTMLASTTSIRATVPQTTAAPVSALQTTKPFPTEAPFTVSQTAATQTTAVPIAAAQTSAAPSVATTEPPQMTVTLGDVNMDGKVNSTDARRVLRVAAKLETLNEIESLLSDLDGNGKINSTDARKLLRIAAKLDPKPDKKIAIPA